MKRQLTFVWLASALALTLIAFAFALKLSVSASNLNNDGPAVHALQRGFPFAAPPTLPGISDFHPNPVLAPMQDQSRSDVTPTPEQPKPRAPNAGVSAPSNDNCANAIPVTGCPFTDTEDTTGATDEVGEPGSACSVQFPNVWYSYAAGANAAVITVSTCDSDFDTEITVFQVNGAPCDFANFVEIACNDDFCGFRSTVQFTAAPNKNYKIQVGGFSGATGNLAVLVDCCTITCPASQIKSNDPNQCGAVVNYPPPTTNGDCGAVECSPVSGSFFPVGMTVVNCTTAAGPGCMFTVTVNDTQAPTITCPANIAQPAAAGQCSAVVTYSNASATDNCPGVGIPSCTPASGSTFPRGVTTVTCMVSDASANSANCIFSVTITDTQAPTITCPPNQSATSSVPTAVNYPAPTAADNCPGVTSSCNPPSGSVFALGTTTVTCTASDTSGNNSTCTFTVTVAPCTITCPSDVITHIGTNATNCGSNVLYPAPAVASGCGPATCSPVSGSLFAVGTTTVTCTIPGGVNCSFTVLVVDDAAPRITCPNSIVTAASQGQSTAVVNYPAATATDNCPGATVQCAPPGGSRFPAGTTFVTCTAIDSSSNSASCVFSVIVVDSESPTIICPANVTIGTQSGQTSAVVSYPPPSVTDNVPGVTVLCSPPSGSSFPLGVTTVTCTATDVAGNKSSCSFTAGVGGPQAKVTLPGGKAEIEFGNPITVAPARKPPKAKKNPCGLFTIQNIGFAPLVLTLDSITRTGNDVDSRKIADANDTRYFSLSLDGSTTSIDFGGVVTIQPGGSQSFCLRFSALIPALAGKATGVAAADALPDTVRSIVTFRQNAGSPVSVSVLSHLATAVIFINPANPRQPPGIGFTRSGNEFTVSYALYDPNLDVSRAKYEFLNSSGQVVGSAFEIDLTEQLRALGLVRGQSFAVEQRFTGANAHPEIVGVRVTVFDTETSVTDSATAASATSASIRLFNRRVDDEMYLPILKFTALLR